MKPSFENAFSMKRLRSIPLLAVLLLSACSRESTPTPLATGPLAQVETFQIQSAERPLTRMLTGNALPVGQATVSVRIMGRVTDADFEIGDTVVAGQILVRLSAPETNARVEQAQAALSKARRDYERESELLARNATTAETVRSLADALRAAEAGLEEAQALLNETEIPAPFDGVITRKKVRTGDLAVPGSPIFRIENIDTLEVRLSIPASLPVPSLKTEIPVSFSPHVVVATLQAISPATDPLTRTREAVLSLPDDSGIPAGSHVQVFWPDTSLKGIWIPTSALRMQGQMQQAFIIENGIARLRLLKTGLTLGDEVQIHAGLQEGETLILFPPSALRDGQHVEAVR